MFHSSTTLPRGRAAQSQPPCCPTYRLVRCCAHHISLVKVASAAIADRFHDMSVKFELPEPDQVIDRLFDSLVDQLQKVGSSGRFKCCRVLRLLRPAPAAAVQVTVTLA